MFENVGWPELLILIIAGLFILGPERLPAAAAQLGKAMRQIKEYATGARDQLRNELGPEYDELRKPLQELRNMRDFNPKTAVTKHLFDGENPLEGITNNYPDHKPIAGTPPTDYTSPQRRPLEPGERPPYDTDAT